MEENKVYTMESEIKVVNDYKNNVAKYEALMRKAAYEAAKEALVRVIEGDNRVAFASTLLEGKFAGLRLQAPIVAFKTDDVKAAAADMFKHGLAAFVVEPTDRDPDILVKVYSVTDLRNAEVVEFKESYW